jgi:hypothetical protein
MPITPPPPPAGDIGWWRWWWWWRQRGGEALSTSSLRRPGEHAAVTRGVSPPALRRRMVLVPGADAPPRARPPPPLCVSFRRSATRRRRQSDGRAVGLLLWSCAPLASAPGGGGPNLGALPIVLDPVGEVVGGRTRGEGGRRWVAADGDDDNGLRLGKRGARGLYMPRRTPSVTWTNLLKPSHPQPALIVTRDTHTQTRPSTSRAV